MNWRGQAKSRQTGWEGIITQEEMIRAGPVMLGNKFEGQCGGIIVGRWGGEVGERR